ncbi:hypothetical protein BYT27DRAFT_7260451 [Phlegmacium glaucopus]|nr:hypothetical protein BYT27DRAFT_7260451 [Phlegmacium glaucopus]
MLDVKLVWAFTRSWLLTLAGLAIAPVFAGAMATACEMKNRKARGFCDTIINIRDIRSMRFEAFSRLSSMLQWKDAFRRVAPALRRCCSRFPRPVFVSADGGSFEFDAFGDDWVATYGVTQKIAKSTQATADLNKLLSLDTSETSESPGGFKPGISGTTRLHNVSDQSRVEERIHRAQRAILTPDKPWKDFLDN